MALAGLTVDLLPSFVIIVTVFLLLLPFGVFISARVFYIAFCTVI